MASNTWRWSIFVFILVALLLASPIRGDGDEDEDESLSVGDDHNESDVVILTAANFDSLTSKGSWLIEFFAPWCGHCKKLKPTWERVATKLDGKINVATVDCTLEKSLQDRFEVKSFPTLKFFRDGSSRMYKGDRSEEALLKFGLDMMKPAVDDVETPKQMKEAIGTTPVSFLFIQGSDKKSGESASKVFDKVAYQNQGVYKFLRARADVDSGDNKLAAKYGVNQASTVITITDGGDDDKFSGAWSIETLSKWMDERKLPLLSELDAANFEDVTQAGKIVIFTVTDPSSTMTKHYLKEALKVAKRYRQFVFANIDGVKFSKYVGQFGIQPEMLPSLFGLNFPRDEFYVGEDLEKYQNENQISRFADDILNGRIPAKGTSAWYSPVGWYKSFEKWLSGLNETQLIIAVACATLLLLALVGFGCYYGAQDLAPDPSPAPATSSTATAAKAAIETKKTS